jgi:hypothetical protein
MDRPNNFLLLGLVRNKNLSPEKQLVIANLDEESGTPHSHSSIADFKVGLAQNLGLSPESAEILVETRGIGWVKTNLARNKAVSLDVVHRAVDGFGLGMNGQSPFEYALFEEFRNGDRNPRAMDKTLVSIIKQIREEEDRLEGDRNNISDRLMLEENYFYLRSAAYQIEERAKAILETQPIEKLSEVMDISVEDFEKYVKPLLEKKQ